MSANLHAIMQGLTTIKAGLQSMTEGVNVLIQAVAANYWNPSDKGSAITLSNGDRDADGNGSMVVRSVTSHSSGKYYAETVDASGENLIGIANSTLNVETINFLGEDANGAGYFGGDGNIYENSAGTAYGSAVSPGDIVQIAVDVTNQLLYFGINGTWQNSSDPGAGSGGYAFSISGAIFLAASPDNIGGVDNLSTADADFTYAPPTGFTAWG